jgi:hypothetical protein
MPYILHYMRTASSAFRRVDATRGVLQLSAKSDCSISSLSPTAVSEIERARVRGRESVCVYLCVSVCVCLLERASE